MICPTFPLGDNRGRRVLSCDYFRVWVEKFIAYCRTTLCVIPWSVLLGFWCGLLMKMKRGYDIMIKCNIQDIAFATEKEYGSRG